MTWALFLAVAAAIVLAGARLVRYGDIIGEKTGLGRSWIGLTLLAATTSLPELFSGVGATVAAPLPDIAVGDVLGSCMFNLLILSMMDAIHPEAISSRAHQGHALSIGFGLLLIGIAGLGLLAGASLPSLASVGVYTPAIGVLYLLGMRVIFAHQRTLRARDEREVAEELKYGGVGLPGALARYAAAAVVVIAGAVWLPRLAARIARETGLGDAFVGSSLVALTTSLPEVVVSLTAVRIGALDLGVANLLGSNLFNLVILALDDLLYRPAPILSAVDASHLVSVLAVVIMNALFLIGLTYHVVKKRFLVAWDTGAIAVVYAVAMTLVFRLRS